MQKSINRLLKEWGQDREVETEQRGHLSEWQRRIISDMEFHMQSRHNADYYTQRLESAIIQRFMSDNSSPSR